MNKFSGHFRYIIVKNEQVLGTANEPAAASLMAEAVGGEVREQVLWKKIGVLQASYNSLKLSGRDLGIDIMADLDINLGRNAVESIGLVEVQIRMIDPTVTAEDERLDH